VPQLPPNEDNNQASEAAKQVDQNVGAGAQDGQNPQGLPPTSLPSGLVPLNQMHAQNQQDQTNQQPGLNPE
jgi:hypothetical protein